MPLTTDEIASLIDLNSGRNATATEQNRIFELQGSPGVPVSGVLSGAYPPEGSLDGVDVSDNQLAIVIIKLTDSPRRPATWIAVNSSDPGTTYDVTVDSGTPIAYVAQQGDTIATISSEFDTSIELQGDYIVNQFDALDTADFNRVIYSGTINPGDEYERPVITTTQPDITIYSDAGSVTFVVWGLLGSTWYRVSDFEKTVTENFADLFGCSAFTRLYVQVTAISGRDSDLGTAVVLVAPCDEQGGGGGQFLP